MRINNQNKKKPVQDEWEEVSGKLIRTFYFSDKLKIKNFVEKVKKLANKQNQTPEFIVQENYVKISLSDELTGSIGDCCHIFALSVDKLK